MVHQLVITPSYMPVDSSVTLINAKIIDKLEEQGVNTVVLTVSTADTSYTVTPELSEIFKSDRRVYRVRSYETGGKALSTFRKALKKVFPIIFYAPDYHFVWQFLAVIRLFKIRRECKINIIHSISAPYASHIVGYFAKLILKRPWVCHLDDFWVDQTLYAEKVFDGYRFINVWLERKCFGKADIILSSSREILELAGLRYPKEIRDKFKFIPPCYNSDHYPEVQIKNNKYRFAFVGKFYPGRREPLTLFTALKHIKNRFPDIYNRIDINLVGINSDKYQKYADELSIADVVRGQGPVDYRESMRVMKEASVLLHLGYISGLKEDIHISGKLFEYLGAERLILALTTPSGPVAEFIRSNGGIVCDYNDPGGIADAIVDIVSTYSAEDLYRWKNPAWVEQLYSVDSVAKSYKEMFQSLTAEHGKERLKNED